VAAYFRSLERRSAEPGSYARLSSLLRWLQRRRPVTVASSSPPAAAPAARKLLVVDDQPDSVEVLMLMLKKFGYDAESVPSAADALSRIAAAADPADRPALMLVDVMMPGMDGLELLKAVRQCPGCESLPILMLTADRGRSLEAFHCGAQDYLLKPIDFNRVRASVDRYLPH
jgi:CheY-like chemotaxis protein